MCVCVCVFLRTVAEACLSFLQLPSFRKLLGTFRKLQEASVTCAAYGSRQRTLPIATHVTPVRRHEEFLFSFRVGATVARFGAPGRGARGRRCRPRAPRPGSGARVPRAPAGSLRPCTFFRVSLPAGASRRRPRRARPQHRASAAPQVGDHDTVAPSTPGPLL